MAREVDESFEYGGGKILQAKMSYLYPVGVTGENGTLDIAEVEKEEAPPLMSRRAMKDLKMILDFEKRHDDHWCSKSHACENEGVTDRAPSVVIDRL